MPGSRNYCFTVNNYEGIYVLDDFGPKATYLIYSEELGANGTPHLQGYVEFDSQITIKALSKLVPGVHFEPRRGSQRQAIAYCCKVSDPTFVSGPHEEGTPKNQGERTDLAELKKMVDDSAPMDEVWDNFFPQMVRYYKGVEQYRQIKEKKHPRSSFESFIISVGGTGLGKSTHARSENDHAFWVSRPNNSSGTLWWDSLDNEETLIIDEFYGWIPFDLLLRLCDKNPLQLEVKGGYRHCHFKKVVITSNLHPRRWYPKISEHLWPSLERRITELRLYTSLGEYVLCNGLNDLENKMSSLYLLVNSSEVTPDWGQRSPRGLPLYLHRRCAFRG